MTISERNKKIYLIATSKNAPTMEEIGEQFGITKQRVSVIVKQVQAQIGDNRDMSQGNFPIFTPAFYVTDKQALTLTAMRGKNFSEKMRAIIDFYAANRDKFTAVPVACGPFPKMKGGLFISAQQKKIIQSVPLDVYSWKIRYIIDFYIKNQ